MRTPLSFAIAVLLTAGLVVSPPPRVVAQADGGFSIATPFLDYYDAARRGPRMLGPTASGLLTANGAYSQYFEKGRLELHPDAPNPTWRFSYGRLIAELLERGAAGPVSGESVSLTYADLRSLAAPEFRHSPPRQADGPQDAGASGVFVPYDADLRAARGHYVARPFWDYLQRDDLFPGGWLHDVGLPLTEVLTASVVKDGQQRTITVQAFERAVLTEDPLNLPGWRIERANIGRDYLSLLPFGGERAAVLAPVQAYLDGSSLPAMSVYLQMVEGDYARVYLVPRGEAQHSLDSAWVFLQRRGGQWQIIEGLGTAFFADSFYDPAGIPEPLRIGIPYELTLNETVRRFHPAVSAMRLVASAGGFAVVEVLGPEGYTAETPTYVYARLTGTPDWVVLGPPAGAFDDLFYQQHRIPAALRLDVLR